MSPRTRGHTRPERLFRNHHHRCIISHWQQSITRGRKKELHPLARSHSAHKMIEGLLRSTRRRRDHRESGVGSIRKKELALRTKTANLTYIFLNCGNPLGRKSSPTIRTFIPIRTINQLSSSACANAKRKNPINIHNYRVGRKSMRSIRHCGWFQMGITVHSMPELPGPFIA